MEKTRVVVLGFEQSISFIEQFTQAAFSQALEVPNRKQVEDEINRVASEVLHGPVGKSNLTAMQIVIMFLELAIAILRNPPTCPTDLN